MVVKEIMTKGFDLLPRTASLKEAGEEMLKHDFGFLPIGEKGGKLEGIVTDRDITTRGVAKGLSPTTSLERVMTKQIFSIHETDDVREAAKLMEKKKVRRLVVLDSKGKFTGILSLGDIATKCDELGLSGEIIHYVSEKGGSH